MKNLAKLIIDGVNGGTFITIDTMTKVKVRKTLPEDRKLSNPHFERISKLTSNLNVMVFQNKTTNAYDNMVKRRLEKEGKDPSSFVLSPRQWGTRVPNTPFVEHKGKYYLEVICFNIGAVDYLLDYEPINQSDIIGLTPVAPSEQGGLEDKVVIRTYSVESICSIKINGEVYDELFFDINLTV